MTTGVHIGGGMGQQQYANQQQLAMQMQAVYASQLQNLAGVGYGGLHQTFGQTSLEPLDRETKFGEIIAYRCWDYRKGFLRSFSADYVWLPGAVEGLKDGQKIEDYGCAGIHAFKTLRDAVCYAESLRAPVIGTVKLWGDVIEYERGYHAEFAKIAAIDHAFGELPAPESIIARLFIGRRKSLLQHIREQYAVL